MDANSDSLTSVAQELAAREPIFHKSAFGASRDDFDRLMDKDFWEVGASGQKYSREFVLRTLEKRHKPPASEHMTVTDFACRSISSDTYLVTYQLEQDGGRLSRRSTLWRVSANGWQILYHQGTIISEA